MSSMVHLISLVCSAVLAASAVVEGARWEVLAGKPGGPPACEDGNPCRINQHGNALELRLDPSVKSSGKTLTKLEIKNLKDRSVELYSLDEINEIDPAKSFEIYAIRDLRPGVGGVVDLAVYAYSSAKEGPMFYYFLYNSSTGKFVMAPGTFPKLKWDGASKRYLSDLRHVPYELDKSLHFKNLK